MTIPFTFPFPGLIAVILLIIEIIIKARNKKIALAAKNSGDHDETEKPDTNE